MSNSSTNTGQADCHFEYLIRASEVFQGKWSLAILCAMRHGPVRLSELRRVIPGASKKMLLQTLKRLEGMGILYRMDLSGRVLHVEYKLHEPVRQSTCQVIDCVLSWGQAWTELPPGSIEGRE